MSEANLNADPSLWERAFVNGEFRIVYATPEILLMEGSYFLRKVVPDANHPFKKKLIAVAFDEAHCIQNWGKFRPYYQASSRLRELLSDFPFIALSATLTPVGIANLKKAARLRNALLVKESIRRYNLMICFARIRQSGLQDLGILIPKDIVSAADIPPTLLFVDSKIQANKICRFLRRKLPNDLKSDECQIIRSYHAAVDKKAKTRTIDGLNDQTTRIAVCTEALGMGVHLEHIVRVFQWKLDSDIGVDTITQRLGRGGRDFNQTALGMVFVSNANLSGNQTTTPDAPDDPNEEYYDTSVNVTKAIFETPVTEETWPAIQGFLPMMYHGPALNTKGNKKTKIESVLVPGVKWTACTLGCRQRALLACFADEKIFFDNPSPDCDNCIVEHLLSNGQIDNPPTIHKIPLSITLAYEPYRQQTLASEDIVKKPQASKTRGPTVNEKRLDILVADLQKWRKLILSPTQSYLHPTMILRDPAIGMIKKHVREIAKEEDLKEVLGKCGTGGRSGHRFPESLLTPYISDLFAAVTRSLASSILLQAAKPRKPVPRPKATASHLRRPISKPACLERTVLDIIIPMPAYRPGFVTARSSLPTSSMATHRPPLAEIQSNSFLCNSIPSPHPPPKSIRDKDEDANDIASNASTTSRFTIKLPMKRIRENDPVWAEGFDSRKSGLGPVRLEANK